jgi:hypothetical protein
MPTVVPCPLPPAALLLGTQAAGAFVDCYTAEVATPVGHAEFVEAFYTTGLFKVERLLIRLFARRATTDDDARALAQGRCDEFAVWSVERRMPDQLLLADRTGRTKSWLMVAPQASAPPTTRLYFGSALIPHTNRRTGTPGFGLLFHLLLGFHRRYSVALLRAAAARLVARAN